MPFFSSYRDVLSWSCSGCLLYDFDLSQKHEKANKETFFGYYKDDKFIKRKGLGRVERTDADGNSLWNKTEEIWLNLYKNKK